MPTRSADHRLPQAPTAPATATAPLVRTVGDRRTLEFMPGDIQSEMRLSRPDALISAYCRAIMAFVLFVPDPRHIVMVGLGGGSLAKFCYRHFAHARITVIELRADVIALRNAFGVPPDDARFQVVHADATDWLAALAATREGRDAQEGNVDGAAGVDVLVVDGFDSAGLPPALGSARFYGDCRRVLHDGGVLVANIFSYDPHYTGMLARLGLMFDGRLCRFDGVAGNNRIVFALKAPAGAPGALAAPVRRALRLQRWVARRNGLGMGLLNRLLVAGVIAWCRSGCKESHD